MKKPKSGEMRSDIQGGRIRKPMAHDLLARCMVSCQSRSPWSELCAARQTSFSWFLWACSSPITHAFPTSLYEDKGRVQILTSTGWPAFSKMFCRQWIQPPPSICPDGSWAGQVLRLKVGGQWHTDLSLTLSEPDSHQVVYSDKEDTDPLPLLCWVDEVRVQGESHPIHALKTSKGRN